MRMFKIGVACVAALVIAGIIRLIIAPAAPTVDPRLEQALRQHGEEVIRVIPLAKTDRLPVPIATPPVVAETVTPRVHEEEPESNICTRYHMRKVYSKGGRWWNCRK